MVNSGLSGGLSGGLYGGLYGGLCVYIYIYVYIYILVGGLNHLEKYESQWEELSHILWKINNV